MTNKPIQIIYEDSNFMVANKPANLSFHCENQGIGFFKRLEIQTQLKLFPVHRLDKVTSGLIIAAKTVETENQFNHLFQSKAIQKFYLGISNMKPKRKQGIIKGDMKESRNGTYKLCHSVENPAITHFKTFQFYQNLISYRAFLFRPLTGRTHQLRVAAKSLGSPLMGDAKYKGEKSDRTYLHAWQLKFKLNNQVFHFKASPNFGSFFESTEFNEKIKNWESASSLKWPK